MLASMRAGDRSARPMRQRPESAAALSMLGDIEGYSEDVRERLRMTRAVKDDERAPAERLARI